MANTALVVIDVQRDFCEGGVLPAKNTASLIAPLNEFTYWAVSNNIKCIFTRDWHPVNHCSFVSEGGPWTPHCVQHTEGAEFASGVVLPGSAAIVDIEKDPLSKNISYSVFENTDLKKILDELNVKNLIVTGISTEYCVKATVMDALKFGFKVSVATDLIRSIDNLPNDTRKALGEMSKAGANLLTSKDFYNNGQAGF